MKKKFIENIIYPKRESNFYVDDAFGIFIGYEIKVEADEKKLPNGIFREKIKERVASEMGCSLSHIKKKIFEYNLGGHNFYIYLLPFTELDISREKLQEGISK